MAQTTHTTSSRTYGDGARNQTQNSTLNSDSTSRSPRPPKTRHPFYSLPAELILSIIDLLPPESFINFAFANYPLLSDYGLAPALSGTRVTYLTGQTRIPALFPLLRLPPEITLHVLGHLSPVDVMRFVLANYQDLARQGIAPALTDETVAQLWAAVCVDIRGG